MNGTADRRRAGAQHLSLQAAWCHGLGSPLYGSLLDRAATDCERGGIVWSILEGQENESRAAAVALRFMGAVHRLVLAGEAPELARHYPSAGGHVGDIEEAWRVFRETLAAHRERLRELARLPVQTNEVGRSAVLFGGFLEVARRTGLPLRLLEIGASGGLNLRWDRYRYEARDAAWGDDSLVCFSPAFEDVHPSFDVRVEVVARAGCDLLPVDTSSEEGCATLRAYLWPDQTERRRRLDGALEIARKIPAQVDRAGAGDWLTQQLGGRYDGAATVVFHSIMFQYVDRDEQARILRTLEAAGERATPEAPLAWLRFEPRKDGQGNWIHQVDLKSWPGGEDLALAISSPHGPPVKWIAG